MAWIHLSPRQPAPGLSVVFPVDRFTEHEPTPSQALAAGVAGDGVERRPPRVVIVTPWGQRDGGAEVMLEARLEELQLISKP